MSKKTRWGNFVNFSYKQKQDVFRQYKHCYCIIKVQNDLYNLGATKQTPKPSRISIETNAHVVHAFLVQLRTYMVRKFSHRLFCFGLKICAQVKLC